MFRNFIQYKLEREEKHFVKIDKMFPSSKLCSICGYKNTELFVDGYKNGGTTVMRNIDGTITTYVAE